MAAVSALQISGDGRRLLGGAGASGGGFVVDRLVDEVGQWGDLNVTDLGVAALLELGGEERVEGFEFLGVVTGKDHSAPYAVGGAGGHRVVAAAAQKRAVGAPLDGAV